MRDLVEVRFVLAPDDFARIEPLLRAAGYRISRSGDEVLADGDGSDLRFKLGSAAAQGLRQARFSLNAPDPRHVETIGRSTLVVGPDANATWTFDPPR